MFYSGVHLNVIILGAGKMGSVIAKDFAKTGARITSGDIDLARAERVAASVGGEALVIDTSDHGSMVDVLGGFDLVIGALPGDYGFGALEACVEAGRDVVDVSFSPESPLRLDGAARDAGVTVIPDCGVAPGLSSFLVGYGASKLDEVEGVKILVGGVPESRVPPLDYVLTFNADNLIDEYLRDVSIVVGGEVVQVPALSGQEEIDFPGVGTLEAFYTDGLRTLIDSFPGASNLYEKTLRYPGHVEKIELLKELGFFSEEPVTVGGVEVVPKSVSARVFEGSLTMDVGDLLAMTLEVSGVKDGERKGYRYTVLEYFDHESGVSAMARTTAYTTSITAQIFAEGGVGRKGVVPMEKLGADPGFAKTMFKELEDRGVTIDEAELG
jgi:saccharopine dehydrogenase-like NADP-dependent oxidoreductase